MAISSPSLISVSNVSAPASSTPRTIDRLIEDKQAMVRGVLHVGAETLLTEMSDGELMAMVALDLRRATAEA